MARVSVGGKTDPNEDGNSFDLNDWLDAYECEPAREELAPDFLTD